MSQSNNDKLWVHDMLSAVMALSSESERSELMEKYRSEHTSDVDELILKDADAIAGMLVRFKNGGDHKLSLLTDSERAELEETEHIINENLFDYYFQPIVNTKDGEIYSYEALMRPKSSMKLTPLHILKYAGLVNRLSDIERGTFLNVLGIIDLRKNEFLGKYVFINSIPEARLEADDFRRVTQMLLKHADIAVVEMTEQSEIDDENLEALKKGIVNLEKHIENLQKYKVPVVVTLNSFITDTEAETNFVKEFCQSRGCEFALSEVWEKGGEGGVELAKKVLDVLENKESNFEPLYPSNLSIKEKIYKVATEIYGAADVSYSPAAERELKKIADLGMNDFPVCMAKTQYSLSDDASLLGRPEGFTLNVREVYASAGAGFIVAVTGSIMTMPGLPKTPAANNIDVTDDGVITGLF